MFPIFATIITPDHGPVYAETDFTKAIVEPVNTATTLLFLIISVYWIIKIWKNRKEHKFLFYSLSVLLLGGVGGVLYHALRSSFVFHILDESPISLLCFAVCCYFYFRAFKIWWPPILTIGSAIVLCLLIVLFVPWTIMTNLIYIVLSIAVIIPIIILLYKTKLQNSSYFFLCMIFFAGAVFFRSVDSLKWTPVGTHFLWHILGACAVFFLIQYVYMTDLCFTQLKE